MRSLWKSVLMGTLRVVAYLAIAAAAGSAFDFGLAPAGAAVLEGTVAVPASEPGVSATGDPRSFNAGDSRGADSGPALAGQPIGPDPGQGFVRLPGHVLDVLSKATPVDKDSTSPVPAGERGKADSMTLTLVLNRDDQPGFDRYLSDVYDRTSKNSGHFLTQAQITQRFGPSVEGYSQVLGYLRAQGFRLVHGSRNRMTLTVRGTRRSVERAFHLQIGSYRFGDASFYANRWDPALPRLLAKHVATVGGLSSLAAPRPVLIHLFDQCSTQPNTLACLQVGLKQLNSLESSITCAFLDIVGFYLIAEYTPIIAPIVGNGAAGVYAGTTGLGLTVCPVGNIFQQYNSFWNHTGNAGGSAASASSARRAMERAEAQSGQSAATPVDGSGQTIGLLEFDSFYLADVSNYLAAVQIPSTAINNLSVKAVNGGVAAPGSGEDEVLLDIDTALSLAQGAKVVVYEAPSSGQAADYISLFNAMINGKVTIISNSWASCEDEVSQAEALGIDTVLQAAAASGISVFNGTGDSGATCLDGSTNTISVPADSPHATAVGGTSLPGGFGPGPTYGSETWWNGTDADPPSGQGGFGTSRYFARPSYQNGLNGSSMRAIPDVVVRADPANGISICQADDGGCPTGYLYGGTSFAAPEWAALAALLNDAHGQNFGLLNGQIYPLAATDAFHSAASMGSDFAHVGLGSPNLNVMYRLLTGEPLGAVSTATSKAIALYQPATVIPTNSGGPAVPADGTSQGGVLVTLRDGTANTLSGRNVTLSANGGHAVITPASTSTTVTNGAAVFTVTDLTAETVTLTATDTTDGVALSPVTLTFGVPPAASGGLSANPPSVPADGQTAATLTVTLKDALNRPTPGKKVTIADGGAHAALTGPTPGVTDANGQIEFSATDQVNETVTFNAVDATDGTPVPGSATVTYSNSTFAACGVGVAPVAGSGYTIVSYLTGLPAAPTLFYGNANIGCPGAQNPAFTSAGKILAADFLTGSIYQTGLAGGAVSSTNILGTLTPALGSLTYGKDGSIYATLGDEGAEVVQIDPATGAQLRVVASGLTCPAGLAVDPLSGDLFFDDQCTGGGTDNASVWRIIDPANSDASRPTSVVVYATLPSTPNGGMAFAPNGTLYAVSGYYGNVNAPVEQISATTASTVTVTPVSGITSDYAVAVGITNSDGSAQSLIAEPAGNLSEIPIATPGAAIVLATGSPGVGVTGPDGCLYSAKYDTIYRLAASSGVCKFAPTSPAPSISLAPGTVSPNPVQGGSQTFTATLHNVSPLSGVPVVFTVTGANAQIKLVGTDANGNATLSYAALLAGKDTIVATASANSTALASNTVQLIWDPGKHTTFLALNLSSKAGMLKQNATVTGSLADVSVYPPAAVSGQTVSFSLDGSSCSAATGSNGSASCSLVPSQRGTRTLNASFAGTGQFVASSDLSAFSVSGPPAAAPTVTISVNPGNVVAGGTAALTWSSANATACIASGSWSGSESTSGTKTVTPAATGSYTYTLTCTGDGGSASASAVLSATLVGVSVTAKSGGGSFSGYLSLCLAFLVLLRLRASLSAGPARQRPVGGSSNCHVVFLAGFILAAGAGSARADTAQSADQTSNTIAPASSAAPPWFDAVYVGARAGSMPVRLNAGKLDAGLAARGYGDVDASTDTSAVGGTLYLGYEIAPHADVEFGYTHRNSQVAGFSGAVPATANIMPFLQTATQLVRGYGNIFSLSFRSRFELAPRLMLDPRVGAFVWSTKVSANAAGLSADETHQGGGITAGLGVAYRLWRGLEIGVGADFFRGSPNNIATLYGGSLEWRFGR